MLAHLALYLLVFGSGLAALSWEVLWQLKSSLALGVSAEGTALALVASMGGMSMGSYLAARILARKGDVCPFKFYFGLELAIAVAGLLLSPGFELAERLDRFVHSGFPAGIAPLFQLMALVALMGLPATAMGATLPVYGLLAQRFQASLALMYALNTAGATVGCLLLALEVIPGLGVQGSIYCVAGLNLCVGLGSLLFSSSQTRLPQPQVAQQGSFVATPSAEFLATLTGFVTFCLEVAWFRALRAVLQTTTTSFALMLSAVLLALAVGAALARRPISLPGRLVAAGVAVLLATPVIERFDQLPNPATYWRLELTWFLWVLALVGLPMIWLGSILPALLEVASSPRSWGRLYTCNTLGAVAGALVSAWWLLPSVGWVPTSWLCGFLLLGTGLVQGAASHRLPLAVVGLLVGLVSWHFRTGVGSHHLLSRNEVPLRLIHYVEGPDSSVAVADWLADGGGRCLVIDGFVATGEHPNANYMAWMGRLPMMLHSKPESALVICFGTGQTVNAVRQENPRRVDVVDINPRVFECADFFSSNQKVLRDPRVSAHVMDGRAWLRRNTQRYDVITLEPMPPRFAGVNALYSREFYQLAASRLNPGGIVTQWLPFHLQPPKYSVAIAATFHSVFEDSLLWVHPNGDGILLGRVGPSASRLGDSWPGLDRASQGRDLSPQSILEGAWLTAAGLEVYASIDGGKVITDDNQLLAYGGLVRVWGDAAGSRHWLAWAGNLARLRKMREISQSDQLPDDFTRLLDSAEASMQSGNPHPSELDQIKRMSQSPSFPVNAPRRELRKIAAELR